MKTPVRFAVRLPDGAEYPISVLRMKRDGTVTRIDTCAIDGSDVLKSGWYTIEGEELEMVTLITYWPEDYKL